MGRAILNCRNVLYHWFVFVALIGCGLFATVQSVPAQTPASESAEAIPGPGVAAGYLWLALCNILGIVLLLLKRTLAGFCLPPILAGVAFLILGHKFHPDYLLIFRIIPVYFPLALVVFAIADSFRNPPKFNAYGGNYRGSFAGGYSGTGMSGTSGGGIGSSGAGGGRGGGFGGGGASGGW